MKLCSGTLDALKFDDLNKPKKFFCPANLEPYICNLLVSPNYRRRGYAKKLLASCEDWSIESGYSAVNLHVNRDDESAYKLYKSLDFNVVKNLNSEILFMRKVLNKY